MSMTAIEENQDAGANWLAYRSRLFHFVRNRVGDDQAAEDIVHDALVKAFAQRHTVNDSERFQSWLYQITRNAMADYFRVQKSSHNLPENIRADDEATTGSANNSESELAACLAPLIDRLPERYRVAVQLADLDGVKQREVASVLGISLSGAKSRVQRGRKLLAELLLECCRIEHDSRGRVVAYEPRESCAGDTRGCD
jgi:RNA polymerase sigma-70 factor (ECF subfamily)